MLLSKTAGKFWVSSGHQVNCNQPLSDNEMWDIFFKKLNSKCGITYCYVHTEIIIYPISVIFRMYSALCKL